MKHDALIADLKLWAASPRVPEKVQLLIMEAIGALSSLSDVSLPESLKEWVLNREPDIALGFEDFGELHKAFVALFGREPRKL